MIAGIIAGIEWVVGAWEAIKEIRVLGRVLKGIACMAEWYAWLNMMKSILGMLEGKNLDIMDFLESAGIKGLFGAKTPEEMNESIANHLSALEPLIQNSKELTERSKLDKSPWNGTHKPPYRSIAISEVLYEFSNIAGTGTMIIMFNPEGFGLHPKAPQIVRYVDEAEIAEFLNSRSWGEYWRVNYLLGGRKRNKNRRAKQTSDIVTGEEYPLPKSEGLDDYVERVLELPNGSDDIIANEFADLINEGFDKSIEQTELMARAIEQGGIGRGIERDGLRITSLVQDKIKEVPSNLKKIITNNPIFKDVGKVTANYKKFLSRVRGLRDGFNNSMSLNSLTKESLLAIENLGALATIQVNLAEATGGIALSLEGGFKNIGVGGATVGVKATPQMALYLEQSKTLKALNTTTANFESTLDNQFFDKLKADSDLDFFNFDDMAELTDLELENLQYLANLGDEAAELSYKAAQARKAFFSSVKEGLKGVLKSIALPPKCIPFIK